MSARPQTFRNALIWRARSVDRERLVLRWSGIVEVHTAHLAWERTYSGREAKAVGARNLYGRKLIEYAKGSFGAAERNGPQMNRKLRDVRSAARSWTIKRAAPPGRAGILPFERDIWSAGMSGTCGRAIFIFSK